MLKKLLNKTISVILIILLNYLAFFAFDLKPIFAYFDGQEMVTDNTMSAGTLDLSAESTENFSPLVTPDKTVTRAIDVQNNGNLLLQTNITTTNLGGDFDLCANLNLEVLAGATTIYNGTLIGLSSTPILVPTSTIQTLNLVGTLTNYDLSLQNKTCVFDLDVNGWQDNIASYGTGGFSDQEALSNVITSGSWSVTSPPMPPEPPMVPPSLPQFSDVVINELMWMGSASGSGDEWVELRNMTSSIMDISGWQLTKKSSGDEVFMLTIPAGKTIMPNGFFLISDYDKENSAINVVPDLVVGSGSTNDPIFALANTDLQLNLYATSTSPILIDTAGNGNNEPIKGDKTNFYSMERNDTPGDGANYDNWHTCLDASSTALYWDAGRTEQGTPGAVNLSVNDPPYTPDANPASSYSADNDSEINLEINNIQDKNIIPDEIAVTNEPPVEDSPNQDPAVENALPDTSVSESEIILPDLPTESQEAIESAPITIESADNQNNNSDPNDNNQ